MNKTSNIANVDVGELDSVRINFMVAGIGGIGKSTFLKLFFKPYRTKDSTKVDSIYIPRTPAIENVGNFLIKTSHVDIDFHLVDTPGYGDSINNQFAIDNIKEYLEEAHNKWSNLDARVLTQKVRKQHTFRLAEIFVFNF